MLKVNAPRSAAVLLGLDNQRSVITRQVAGNRDVFIYSPFGFSGSTLDKYPLPGFTAQILEAAGLSLLGNGKRAYNPVLMRFHSPDAWSPFGMGGINPYAYCEQDPINWQDLSGNHREKSRTWSAPPGLPTIHEIDTPGKLTPTREEAKQKLSRTPIPALPEEIQNPYKRIEKLKKLTQIQKESIEINEQALNGHISIDSPLTKIEAPLLGNYIREMRELKLKTEREITLERHRLSRNLFKLTIDDWSTIDAKVEKLRADDTFTRRLVGFFSGT
ncbi:RHS repeat-associated core domain-containing protein [Pantoea sp. Cy-639]|uniref:RHS repeat-associated core domain-containing protein n=1 Tax=Pantoea sp. Cy-639 TaxID=2608360 RepID=UPI00142294D3|nr:RHS repeat-associated core domain-containing protein [Pantoea sp. Cy-639]NIF17364.1 RHS repeat-associated core domain-containing protein [Pantoea sp. Cy-639]